jgi:hypothetical protein
MGKKGSLSSSMGAPVQTEFAHDFTGKGSDFLNRTLKVNFSYCSVDLYVRVCECIA